MKKVCMMITVLALMASFAACGSTTESSSTAEVQQTETAAETTPETTAEPETEEVTEAPTEAETEAVTEAPEESAAESSAAEEAADGPTMAQAKELMEALNTIDKLAACGIEQDKETTFTDANGVLYYKVTSTQFAGTEDVRNYMNRYLTEDFINERYVDMLGGDAPVCIDNDGALFIKDSAKGGGFAFADKDPVIEKTSEDSYSILAEYDNYGTTDCLDIRVMQKDGGWKISGFSFGM